VVSAMAKAAISRNFLFPSRLDRPSSFDASVYAGCVRNGSEEDRTNPAAYGTHTLRRTKQAMRSYRCDRRNSPGLLAVVAQGTRELETHTCVPPRQSRSDEALADGPRRPDDPSSRDTPVGGPYLSVSRVRPAINPPVSPS